MTRVAPGALFPGSHAAPPIFFLLEALMTLDQSLANLQYQADRLANLFSATADAIEARTGAQPLSVNVTPEMARAVADGFATRMPRDTPFHGEGQAAPLNWQPTPPEDMERMRQARDEAVASIAAEAQVPEVIYNPENGEHKHWAMAQPETPQGVAPSSAPPVAVPPASAVEVEGPGVGAPETPRPADPTTEAPPWNENAPGSAPGQPEKKGGRRSNEEIAAEIGVDLDAVKKWKGGGRISKKDMEEYKRLFPEAVVAPQGAPFAQGPVTTPPDGSHLPQQASAPFGGQPAANPTPPPYDNGGQFPAQGAPQEWPTAQPVAQLSEPAPGEQFGEWQQAPASDSQWDPFKQ